MTKSIKPNSEYVNNKWIPSGLIVFSSDGVQTEHVDRYYENKFNSKEEADKYFIQANNKK
jgi:hypothetical protein